MEFCAVEGGKGKVGCGVADGRLWGTHALRGVDRHTAEPDPAASENKRCNEDNVPRIFHRDFRILRDETLERLDWHSTPERGTSSELGA